MAGNSKWNNVRMIACCCVSLLAGLGAEPDILAALGFAAGIIFLSFGIAIVIKGRKSPRNWDSITQWFFWMVIVLSVMAYNGKHANPSPH